MSSAAYRMQIEWQEKTEEWFIRASEYTGFHAQLAKLLLPQLESRTELCDLGCGSGLIDLQLQPNFKKITCIDQSAQALELLERKIKASDITNIRTSQQDIYKLKDQWDNLLLLFTGYKTEHIKYLLSHCREKILFVSRGGCIHNPYVSKSGKHSILPLIQSLQEQKVHFALQQYELEYGQPFLDKEEAGEYVRYYHKNPQTETVEDYVKAHVFPTKDATYHYYMPYRKQFAIFVIDKRENMHLI